MFSFFPSCSPTLSADNSNGLAPWPGRCSAGCSDVEGPSRQSKNYKDAKKSKRSKDQKKQREFVSPDSKSSCIRMPLDSSDFEAAAAMASKRRNRLRQRRPHRPGSKRKHKGSNRSRSFWGGQDWHGLKRETR